MSGAPYGADVLPRADRPRRRLAIIGTAAVAGVALAAGVWPLVSAVDVPGGGPWLISTAYPERAAACTADDAIEFTAMFAGGASTITLQMRDDADVADVRRVVRCLLRRAPADMITVHERGEPSA